jgi:hypothetical protein
VRSGGPPSRKPLICVNEQQGPGGVPRGPPGVRRERELGGCICMVAMKHGRDPPLHGPLEQQLSIIKYLNIIKYY